jgi:hypothetical protein
VTAQLAIRRKWTVVIVAITGLVVAVIVSAVWYGVAESLRAEKTLHAYILVSDVVATYVAHNKEWPQNWNALADTLPSEAHHVWVWPDDLEEIRNRVSIDFSLQLADVAAMQESSFRAVQQLGPSYGSIEHMNKEVIDAAKNASRN